MAKDPGIDSASSIYVDCPLPSSDIAFNTASSRLLPNPNVKTFGLTELLSIAERMGVIWCMSVSPAVLCPSVNRKTLLTRSADPAADLSSAKAKRALLDCTIGHAKQNVYAKTCHQVEPD